MAVSSGFLFGLFLFFFFCVYLVLPFLIFFQHIL